MQAAMVELYRKHKINPMSGCLPLLLQMPVFIGLYQLLYRLVELKGATFLWIKNLAAPDQALTLPFTLPLVGNGIHALPIIMAAATFLQQKLTTNTDAMNEQQKMMITIMPVMMLFIFYSFPAGLVIYWLTNTVLTTAYQLRLKAIKD
jgi:YidC/Oxa1 family membrane protein insertase